MSGGSSSAAVLVGGAVCTQHPDADQRGARTTLDLMVDAARAAAADALATDGPGVDRLLGEVAWVGVPEGTWPAPDPGRLVADALGLAGSVPTVWAAVGVTQQELIASAVAAVADGARAALVVGGEAKARRRLLERAGTPASEIETAQHPDVVPTVAMRPGDLGVDDLEIVRNTVAPVTSFALIENAWRAGQGLSIDEHRRRIGTRWAAFAAVAAGLDWAWDRSAPDAAAIVEPSASNRLLAWPYTRGCSSQWNVDQAAALLVVSPTVARRHGIPELRWVHPLASAVSNHSVPVHARPELDRAPGAALAARRVLAHVGVEVGELGPVDCYSCFPAAVAVLATELGLDLDTPTALSVTGGMTFAGGPLNNYVLGAMAELATRMRASPGVVGLSTSVSGSLVKQGVGAWVAGEPTRAHREGEAGFVHLDVSDEVAATAPAREVTDEAGDGRVVSYTVTPDGATGEVSRVVAVLELDDGRRTIGQRVDAGLAATVMAQEWIGARVSVDATGTLG